MSKDKDLISLINKAAKGNPYGGDGKGNQSLSSNQPCFGKPMILKHSNDQNGFSKPSVLSEGTDISIDNDE